VTCAPQTPYSNNFIIFVVIGSIVAVVIAHHLGALPFLAFQNRRTNWRAIFDLALAGFERTRPTHQLLSTAITFPDLAVTRPESTRCMDFGPARITIEDTYLVQDTHWDPVWSLPFTTSWQRRT